MRQALYTRVLEQTATTLGGQDALAVFLNVAPALVDKWMTGGAPIPQDVFLACVDHLLDWEFAHVRDLPPSSSSDGADPSADGSESGTCPDRLRT